MLKHIEEVIQRYHPNERSDFKNSDLAKEIQTLILNLLPPKYLTFSHIDINGMKIIDGRYNCGYNDCLDEIKNKFGVNNV